MKNTPFIISGQAFIEEELALQPVDIYIEGGIITAIEESARYHQYGSVLHFLMHIPISGTLLRWIAV